MAVVVSILSRDDIKSKGEACRCLASLTLNPDIHSVVNNMYSLTFVG